MDDNKVILKFTLDKTDPLQSKCLDIFASVDPRKRSDWVLTAILLYSQFPVESHCVVEMQRQMDAMQGSIEQMQKMIKDLSKELKNKQFVVGASESLENRTAPVFEDEADSAFNLPD